MFKRKVRETTFIVFIKEREQHLSIIVVYFSITVICVFVHSMLEHSLGHNARLLFTS